MEKVIFEGVSINNSPSTPGPFSWDIFSDEEAPASKVKSSLFTTQWQKEEDTQSFFIYFNFLRVFTHFMSIWSAFLPVFLHKIFTTEIVTAQENWLLEYISLDNLATLPIRLFLNPRKHLKKINIFEEKQIIKKNVRLETKDHGLAEYAIHF